MQSRIKRRRITYNRLRGCGNRQQGQDRARYDRAKGANPLKEDTFGKAIKPHHRCSSMREGLAPNVSHEGPYPFRTIKRARVEMRHSQKVTAMAWPSPVV
jgi:hypothetical protein